MSKNPWDKYNFGKGLGHKPKTRDNNGFLDNDQNVDQYTIDPKNRRNSDENKSNAPFGSQLHLLLRSTFGDFGGGDYWNFLKYGFFTVFSIWILTGIYIVNPEQQAVVTRFGKYTKTESSGLHYHLPFPIESITKIAVTRIYTIKIGVEDGDLSNRFYKAAPDVQRMRESMMLTGDENVVDMQFEVQWKISDIKSFVFNVRDQVSTISDVAQSVLREIVAQAKLSSIMTNGRSAIEAKARELVQDILDEYGAGVEIVLVQMLKADPPQQVIDAFRDVQTARVDRESEINRADAYRNDILPKARGRANEIINGAEGYAAEIVRVSKGQARRFDDVYEQYKNAKYVTRKRMYLETMSEILGDMDKIIIDGNASKSGIMPYLPIQNFDKSLSGIGKESRDSSSKKSESN